MNIDFKLKYLKYKQKYLLIKKKQIGGSKSSNDMIDLTNIKPNIQLVEMDSIEIKDSANKLFKPMFENPLNAKKISPTDSVHLVIPGLMPAYDRGWKKYSKKKIFYMPNDFKPHFHGDAMHHMNMDGFSVNKVFSINDNKFVDVLNKKLEKYRQKIINFNNGEESTPIETWIHWKIPYNEKEYPQLKVKKDSIIWWDFTNMHNLKLVSKENYNNNKSNNNEDILIKLNNNKLQIIVTIMNKIGTYYFLCSVGNGAHAELGHKITIQVI